MPAAPRRVAAFLRALVRRNLPYKIIALAMSGVLYAVANAQQNPRTTRDFIVRPEVRGLPDDLLVISSPKSFLVTVSGSVGALRALPSDGPSAWLDATVARTGVNRLEPHYDLPPDARSARVEVRGKPFVEVVVDARGRRRFSIEVPPVPAATGFLYKPAVVRPPETVVSGSKTQVDKVSHVLASVEPSRGDSTISGAFDLVALDDERQAVPGVHVEPARAQVRLELTQATATKSLLVSAGLTGQEAPGFQVYDAQVEPHALAVVGLQDRLAVLPGLIVLVDVQGLRENAARQVTPILPAGVRLAPGAPGRVTVRLRVRPLSRSGGGASGNGANVPAPSPVPTPAAANASVPPPAAATGGANVAPAPAPASSPPPNLPAPGPRDRPATP